MALRKFQRGEPILIGLGVSSGDPDLIDSISAKLKRALPGRKVPPADTAVAAVFGVTEREATDTVPAGWTLTIDAETSATLAPAVYVTTAAAIVAGDPVDISDPLFIEIEESTL